MDVLLQGIVNSKKPLSVKKTVIARISAASRDASHPSDLVVSMLGCSLNFIVDGEDESVMMLCQPVFVDWATNHQATFVEFFSQSLLSDLLQTRHSFPLGVMWAVPFSLGFIQRNTPTSYLHLCQIVGRRASSFVSFYISDFEVVKSFCSLLLEHRECIPKDDSLHTFTTLLLRAVSRLSVPKDLKAFNQFIVDVPGTIGKLLQEIWICDSDVVADTLQTIFDIVTSRSNVENMTSLGAVVQFVPDVLMRSVLQSKATDASISDETALMALSRMLDMLCWPSTKNIDMWIITFMRGLASVHRYSVLMCIAGSKVDQMFEQLTNPLVQHGFFNVVSYMLLSIQHSPIVFHKIVGAVPDVVSNLQRQDTKAATYLLDSLVELVDCLMFQHPGFPDLYEPIVDALKDFAHPSCAAMRDKLKQYAWSSTVETSSTIQSDMLEDSDDMRSETGLTGLCNLGNTCYINSVLQALYMCDSFRRDVLSSVPSASQTLQMCLQQVFAFLSGTQRSAYSPEKFVQSSRPSWFTSGVQQDCSEFLRYLLNTVHEQEVSSRQQMSPASASSGKAEKNQLTASLPRLLAQSSDESRPPPSIVEQSFAGLLSMTCHCLQCGTISSRTESFMDLALAIPAESQLSQPAPSATSSSHSTPAMVGGAPHSSSSDDLQTKSSSTSVFGSLSLTSLLQRFLTVERLEGDNQYHCDGPCNSLQDGERHVEICSSPTYLIVTLMRFSYDSQTGSHSKIFTDIQYPLMLTIPVQSLPPESGFHQETYGLVGVIVHSGSSSDAGHYFCYVRHALKPTSSTSVDGTEAESEQDCFAGRWFLFNDSRVTMASWDNICSLSQKFSRDTAYVLIYRRVDTVGDTSTDVGVVTDPFALDPPLHRYLCDMIDEDNRLYFQEKERRQRSRLSVKSDSRLKIFSSQHYRRDDDDNDDDNLPPGGMNGGFGSFHNGPRVIF